MDILNNKERVRKLKMDKVAGSKNDEFYTPYYAVKPILKYLKKGATIWCPFDTQDSQFVKSLQMGGYDVIATHIEDGYDFFEYEPNRDSYDYIVSNPPYSLKTEVLERLFELGKPFAMLIGVVGLFESQRRFEMFRDNDWEIMYLNRRVSFMKDFTSGKTALNLPFSSVYITHDILPKQVVFEEIDKKQVLLPV